MPTYTRVCDNCSAVFDVHCKIVEKNLPIHKCPKCTSIMGLWQLSSPSFSMRGDRYMHNKKDSGFSEVLSKIKERNQRTPICEQ